MSDINREKNKIYMNERMYPDTQKTSKSSWLVQKRERNVPVFHGGGLRLDGLSCRAGVAHVPPSSRLQEGRLHVLLQECQLKNGGGGGSGGV